MLSIFTASVDSRSQYFGGFGFNMYSNTSFFLRICCMYIYIARFLTLPDCYSQVCCLGLLQSSSQI